MIALTFGFQCLLTVLLCTPHSFLDEFQFPFDLSAYIAAQIMRSDIMLLTVCIVVCGFLCLVFLQGTDGYLVYPVDIGRLDELFTRSDVISSSS